VADVRDDPLTGVRVLVAPGRADRPDAFRSDAASRPRHDDDCPFCAGNEARTPPEVARTGPGAPDTPGWRVRVVPNLYPIRRGAHEVVVLSPAHDRTLGQLDASAAREALLVVRDRAAHHAAAGCAHVQAFVNQGRAAGASIEHPHAQLVGLDDVPPAVAAAADRFAAAARDLVAEELAHARDAELGVRSGAAAAWCPPASASPYAVRCAVEGAGPRFEDAADTEVSELADALRDVVRRVEVALGPVAYNVVVRSAPRDTAPPFHWWVDVLPRVTTLGGFELGTGILVNPVAPAAAARALKEAT
jgi:UDPglucose--hexose-1-phosphate uridylyltransferase